ncbi:MAG: autotransporter domain-containing protein [Paenalcaligenes sp.]
MNKTFCSIWNQSLGAWVAAPETAKVRGKSTSTGAVGHIAGPQTRSMPLKRGLALAIAAVCGLFGYLPEAQATCINAGLITTCSGPANPLMPSYVNPFDDLQLTVNQGASVGVLVNVGGSAMTLTGKNVSVTNNGGIDAYALGSPSAVSAGLVIGLAETATPSVGTYTITNQSTGLLRGAGAAAFQSKLADLKGMALAVHNGVGGVTSISNSGHIAAAGINNSALPGADLAAVAVYGGGEVSFTNTTSGTITGRVAFESAGSRVGHRFTNAGTIEGSVSLGVNSKNTFVAESGSIVRAGGGTNGAIGVDTVSGLNFTWAGRVDGGAGGTNSLIFADTANRGVTTDVTAGTYLNFTSLTVTGGTWRLSGVALLPAGSSATLNGGMVLVDSSGGLGTGAVTATGGGIGASTTGVVVSNTFMLGSGGLTAGGVNDFTLSGPLTGTGRLTVASTGTVTLTGSNNYSGDTLIVSGASLKGDTDSLQGAIVNNGTVFFSSMANGTYEGAMSGSGALTKQGTGTLTIAGALSHQGNTAIEAGTLQVNPGGSLSALSRVNLSSGAALDLSSAGNQTVNGLSGTGTVLLGGTVLSLSNASAATFGGVISGTGGLTKTGGQKQTLTGANIFTGIVDIQAGTLALGAGGRLAAGSGVNVRMTGEFDISAASNTSLHAIHGAGGQITLGTKTLTVGGGAYNGVIAGTGGVNKNTTAELILNGVNTYTGATQVNAGALWVGGSAANAGARLNSSVTVSNDASIGGFGQVNGDVDVQAGGRLAPGDPGGAFTVNGNLVLAQGSQLDVAFGAPGNQGTVGAGHSMQVNGNLTLNGAQLNVNNAGGFGAGIYRLFDYTGVLTRNTDFTNMQVGHSIQYIAASKQINLINSSGLTLNIWNANRLAMPTQMGGGSGTWSRTSHNWTDVTATVTGLFSPIDGFAIFGGAPGTVTVDATQGSINAKGVQFLSDGYRLNGDALNLVAPSAGIPSDLRVGDGSLQSSGWTATLDNVVAGDGLNKTGLGTLVLTGANTYAQTYLSAGTLSVSSDMNLGSAQGGLNFRGGTLRVTGTSFQNTARAISLGAEGGGLDIADASNTFTVSQDLSGNGGLTKLGAGTLVLTGANTYLGTTTVTGGRLQVGDGAIAGSMAGNADVQAGGTLAFKRSDRVVYAGVISGTGNLRQEGSGTLVLTGDNSFTGVTTIASGSLQIGDGANGGSLGGTVINNGSLTFNRETDSVFVGALAGSGSVFKVGASTLTLTGNSSSYVGTALLADGALQVDGKLGGTTLALAGTQVSGTGSLNNLMVGQGATLAPGSVAAPFGSLNVLGNLNIEQGASYRVAASADGQHSYVNVAGSAHLAGSVLHVGENGSYAPSTTYTILTAGGGVQGRFDAVSSNLAFLTPSLAYGSNKVDLSVQLKKVPDGDNGSGTRPIEFADAAFTGNQRAVARALQSLPADSALFRRVLNLLNEAPADAFNGMSGETHATTVAVAQSVASTFVQIPMNRLRANLGAAVLPGVPTAQPLWAQVFGNWNSLAGNGNAARTTQSDSGVSVGGDVAVGGGWRLGGALGYSNSSSRIDDRASKSRADSYSLTVYGGKAFEAGSAKLNLSLGMSYTWHNIKTQRYADAAGLPQTLKADYGGNTTQVFGELGYAMALSDSVTLEPFVGAGFSSLRTDSFTESGGDAALRGDAGRNNVTTTTLGLHARSVFDSAGALGQLHGTLGWRHAFGDVNPASTMSFVQGGKSFTTNGVPIAQDAAVVELGVNMEVSKRTTVGVIYGGQFGAGNQQHLGTLDLRYRF